MVNPLFSLIAALLRLLAWAAGTLRLYNPLGLLWTAWQIGRDSQDAAAVVSLTAGRDGVQAARQRAKQMFELIKDCQILSTMAWVEIAQQADLEAANKWFILADEQGVLNRHVLLPLKLYLSDHLEHYDKAAIIEEILGRNDLPAEYTRGALLDKAAMLLKAGRWSEAEEIADRVLKIEEHPHAIWVKWVTAAANGKDEEAQKFLARLHTRGVPGYIYGLIALGWLYMGNRHEAMRTLHEAQKYNVNVELFDKELAELTKTAEYYQMQESEETKE
jgi:tetratricopeptide (TPR) repeat protein